MARLFVGVWLPDRVADRVEAMSRPDRPGVRWTTRAQWHVTLRFLGRAEPDEAAAALDGLRAPPREVIVGAEPMILGATILALPVDGLDDLAEEVSVATAGIGDAAIRPDFRGHVTLARTRRGVPAVAPLDTPLRFGLREIVLVESETRPEGARYGEVARFPLRMR